MITNEQYNFIDMYIRGESISSISRNINKSRQTIYEWLKKEEIENEIEKRKEEYIKSTKTIILKDLTSYIENVKELANDKSDKRVALAANRYLIDKIICDSDNQGDKIIEKRKELSWDDVKELDDIK